MQRPSVWAAFLFWAIIARISMGTVMRTIVLALSLALLASSAHADGKLPSKVGACVVTKIKNVTTRLEGIDDSGDAVNYTNGGYQVSYTMIAGLKGAKAGDPVKLCLTSLPDDCPPGDDRGKTYHATDLITHKSWDAADAEHACGGA
jgi:hypothetical protein